MSSVGDRHLRSPQMDDADHGGQLALNTSGGAREGAAARNRRHPLRNVKAQWWATGFEYQGTFG